MWVLTLCALILGMFSTAPEAIGQTVEINNTAYVNYVLRQPPGSGVGGAGDPIPGSDTTNPSNRVTTVVQSVPRTPSTITFHKFAPNVQTATDWSIVQTEFRSGGPDGQLISLIDPVNFGQTISLQNDVPAIPADLYHVGEPFFVTVEDLDQNLDPGVRETRYVTLAVDCMNDTEVLRLTESGADTGVFIGYIQSTSQPAGEYNGLLSVENDAEIVARYVDVVDGTDIAAAAALVDPFGLVFDSRTGAPVNGATVTIVDVNTGQPAAVLGDDGVSTYPSTVITGQDVTDGGGNVYPVPDGRYRFPVMWPGKYRLEVTPPTAYSFPTVVSDQDLQQLPAAPFTLVTGSRGEEFDLVLGPALRIDVPLDPAAAGDMFVRKTPSRPTVGRGDFLRYDLVLENPGGVAISGITLTDILPLGFRYRNDSAYLDNVKIGDPDVSNDGRTLVFGSLGDLNAATTRTLRYVVEVSAGSRLGDATNRAYLIGAGGEGSNVAEATVLVTDDLRGMNTLVGRVMIRGPQEEWTPQDQTRWLEGVEGVRIYLEDGTFVVTDDEGRFHFEGVRGGVHVVQLDTASLPEQFTPVAIPNTRFAGRPYSQFVDLQAGALWRTDFFVQEKPREKAVLEAKLTFVPDGSDGTVRLDISNRRLPVARLRAIAIVPRGYQVSGTQATWGGQPIKMAVRGSSVTVEIPDRTSRWRKSLAFPVERADAPVPPDSAAKAICMVDLEDEKNLKTALMTAPLGQGESASEATRIEREVPWSSEEEEVEEAPLCDQHDGQWLSKAGPDFEWVEPEQGYAPPIPSLKMGIKYPYGHKVNLLYEGKPVDPFTVDSMLADPKKTTVLKRWRGLSLREGGNLFEAVLLDKEGKELKRIQRNFHYSGAPVRAELVKSESVLVADGRTSPQIALRFFDKHNKPVRGGVVGDYIVDPPYIPLRRHDRDNRFLEVGEAEERVTWTTNDEGIGMLKLEPTPQSGLVTVRVVLNAREYDFEAWLEPALRDWILVGVAHGTAAYNDITSHMKAFEPDEISDAYMDDGRIAFFAKGRVLGKYLLTLAYDNQKRRTRDGQESLHQTIDPDAYYTLYGDETDQGYEAASSRKLYVKLERGTFYAMFGDFDTGLTVTELSRYTRSLTGGKTEYRGRNFTFNGFVSDTNLSFARDEIRGDGTSGRYRLTRSNIVINSDKIRLETRDRFHSEKILKEELLLRHLDYNIDYREGTIYFKKPVYSKDEQLNPIFIVAEYEANDGGDKSYNYGGRASVRTADDRVELGATHIHEGRTGGDGNLYGADFRYDLTKDTELRAEAARTDSDFAGESRNGNAYLVELAHTSVRLDGRVYYREQDGEFGLGQQNASEGATRKYGVDGRYELDDRLDVITDIYRLENLGTGATRDAAELSFENRWEDTRLRLGYIWAEDKLANGETKRSDQVHAGVSQEFLSDRVILRLDNFQSVNGHNGSVDYPTRSIFGVDFSVNEKVNLFAEYEITDGENLQTEGARFGVLSQPWTGGTIHSSVTQRVAEDGGRVFANLGLMQKWQLNEAWRIDAGVDSTRTFSETGQGTPFNVNVPNASGGAGGEDFTALSLGATYQQEDWSWTMRLEQRFADNEDRWSLFTGIIGEVDEGVHMSLAATIFDSQAGAGGDNFETNIRYGLAWRPDDSKWMILDRLDLIFEDASGGTLDTRTARIVNQADFNYLPHERCQIALQYGFKYVVDDIESDSFDGFTHFIGLETRHDISERFDIGLRGSALHSINSNSVEYSFGPSIGFNPATNMWISVGYNVVGYYDEDFSRSNYTAQGSYIQFRMKIDQDTMKDLGKLIGFEGATTQRRQAP